MHAFKKVRELTKKQIRNKILLKLRTQKEEQRSRKSRIIQKKLFSSRMFRKAKTVMFYISFDGEVKTEDMIREAKILGKKVVAPVCKRNKTMKACLVDGESGLRKGPYGILEPASNKRVNLKNLDLVVVPGLAFDHKGARLGRGEGYYDRFLKKLHPKTASCGLAFDFQILPSIPTTKMDVGLNRVIFA